MTLTSQRRSAPGVTRWAVALFRTYPVTVMVTLPFFLLIIPPAVSNSNPDLGFIIKVFALATFATGGTETVIFLFRQAVGSRRDRSCLEQRSVGHTPPRLARRYFHVAVSALLVGMAANFVTAAMGIGTIESQVGVSEAASGVIPSLITMLRPYDIIGGALLIWAYRVNGMGRKTFVLWLLFALLAKFAYVLELGITVQFWRYLSLLMFLLVFARLIRLRTILMVGVAVAVIWPTVYEYRNQERQDRGVGVVEEMDAADRLRYDLQVTAASRLEPGQDIGQIPWYEIPRYGVIPSVIDQDRQPVNTGVLINQRLLGGSSVSAFTFLPVATAYILNGPVGMVALYSIYALVAAWLIDGSRYLTGGRFIAFALFVYGPLGWFYVFPDSGIAFLQALTTAVPVFFLIVDRRKRRDIARLDVNQRNLELDRIAERHSYG